MSFTREIIEEQIERERQIREVYDLISLLLSFKTAFEIRN